MLFVEPTSVNEVWARVAQATARNELGIAAKVTPREERGSPGSAWCAFTRTTSATRTTSPACCTACGSWSSCVTAPPGSLSTTRPVGVCFLFALFLHS